MDEKFACPHCQQHMVIEDAPLGAAVKCPNCRNEFHLPTEPSLKRRLASPWTWCIGAALGAMICAPLFLSSKSRPAAEQSASGQAAAVPVASSAADDEVVYQGKPLRVWIDSLDTGRKREERDEARKMFQQIGAPVVPALIRITQDTRAKDHHRGNAAYALAYAGTRSGPEVQVLAAALKDEMDYVRYAAIDALRILWIDNQVLLGLATEMLADRYAGVRRHAAVTLGALGSTARESLPGLQKLVDDPDPRTREAVVAAIAKISAAPQVTVMKSTSVVPTTRLEPPKFAFANERLNAAANDMASTDPVTKAKAVAVIKDIGKAAAPHFIRGVADRSVTLSERRIAAEALGYVGSREGPEVQVLLTAVDDQDSGVRANALKSLGSLQIDPKILVPLSIRMLDDSNSVGRRRAAENLATLGAAAKAAIPVLQSKANHKVRDTREAVNAALKKILAAVEAEEKGAAGK